MHQPDFAMRQFQGTHACCASCSPHGEQPCSLQRHCKQVRRPTPTCSMATEAAMAAERIMQHFSRWLATPLTCSRMSATSRFTAPTSCHSRPRGCAASSAGRTQQWRQGRNGQWVLHGAFTATSPTAIFSQTTERICLAICLPGCTCSAGMGFLVPMPAKPVTLGKKQQLLERAHLPCSLGRCGRA